jgi:hypothetical protein
MDVDMKHVTFIEMLLICIGTMFLSYCTNQLYLLKVVLIPNVTNADIWMLT